MCPRLRPDGSGLFCPNCGKQASTEHDYCIHCGHDLSDLHAVAQQEYDFDSEGSSGGNPTTSAGAGRDEQETEDDLELFRKRVRHLVAKGWDIEHDGSDEVVLVDRGLGSIPVHILLLIFTGGVGNLLYAWYHYSVSPERVVLRADGDGYEVVDPRGGAVRSQAYDEPTSSLTQFTTGLIFLVIGLLLVAADGLLSVLTGFGLVFLLVSLFMMPPTRRRLANRHSPTTFGSTTSVDERYVDGTDRPCTVCGCRVEDGIVRDYKREYVVAGIPLYTLENGANYYCQDCKHDGSLVEDVGSSAAVAEHSDVDVDEIDRELERIRNAEGSESNVDDTSERATADEQTGNSEQQLASERE